MRSTTPRITPIPTLVLALALGAASLVGARAEAQRSSTVDLRELELARDGRRNGQLALHFALARGARPDVQLHVSVDGARRDRELVATLDARAGWIPLGRSGRVTSVMIRATDRRGRVLLKPAQRIRSKMAHLRVVVRWAHRQIKPAGLSSVAPQCTISMPP